MPVFVDPLNSQGNDPFNLNVRYSGANPIDVSTLDDTDILITGPNGYSKMGTFFSAPPNGAGDDTTPSDVDLSGGELGSFEVSLEVVGVQRRVENTWFAKPQATAGAFEAIRARVSSRRLEVWDQGEMSR